MRHPSHGHTAVVVGGGITGLVAARRLALSGLRVTLVEGGARLGGQVHTVDFAGRAVDVGAEALHLGAPSVRRLLDELGLTDDVVTSRPGASLLWVGGRLRPLPAGVGPAGPTRLRPVLSSGVMSLRGLGRAGLEPLATQFMPALAADADTSVGGFLAARFGREVTDRLVDPLLGSLHAGDIEQLSLRACVPSLVGPASERRSIILRRRGPARAGGSSLTFASFTGGLRVLVDRLVAGCDVDVRMGLRAVGLDRVDGQLCLQLSGGEHLDADAVVLAVPSAAALGLLDGAAPMAARRLEQTRSARVATTLMSFDRRATEPLRAFRGTGLLVPSSSGLLLKAMTHLSRKWPQLDDGKTTLVRVSAGRSGDATIDRLDDDALVPRLRAELEQLTGLTATPDAVHVQRWTDGLPQLTVGHRARIQTARDDLARELPGAVLAGASYDGIGLAACISSAEAAASAVLEDPNLLNQSRSLT